MKAGQFNGVPMMALTSFTVPVTGKKAVAGMVILVTEETAEKLERKRLAERINKNAF
jgi:hypothetical protein